MAVDLVNEETGEIYAEAGEEIVEVKLAALEERGVTTIATLAIDPAERAVDPQHADDRQERQP